MDRSETRVRTSEAQTGANALRDLRGSVALLAFVVLLALVKLGFQGNWPKVLRVSVSFTVYGAVLLSLARRSEQSGVALRGARLRWVWFSAAGAAAGVASGVLQTVFHLPTLVLATLGAALILGTVHWIAVCSARRTFDRMLGVPPARVSASVPTR